MDWTDQFSKRFDDFIDIHERDRAEMHQKIDHVTKRVDDLWDFKMKLVGIFAGVSGLVSACVTLFVLWFKAF